jgi:cadmium resistance protein CadD (predicted permease)
MAPAMRVILPSLTTFAATNIDDLAVLTLFFAHQVPTRNIVFGQCLGFTLILLLSLAGFSATISIPSTWVRFLGLLPLAIGVKNLFVSAETSPNRELGSWTCYQSQPLLSLTVATTSAFMCHSSRSTMLILVPYPARLCRSFTHVGFDWKLVGQSPDCSINY